jgi:hypothetical protein
LLHNIPYEYEIVIGVAHDHDHSHSHADGDLAAELAKEANYVLGATTDSKSSTSTSSSSPAAVSLYDNDDTSELMSFLKHQYGDIERLPDGKLRLPHEQAVLDTTNNVCDTFLPSIMVG